MHPACQAHPVDCQTLSEQQKELQGQALRQTLQLCKRDVFHGAREASESVEAKLLQAWYHGSSTELLQRDQLIIPKTDP